MITFFDKEGNVWQVETWLAKTLKRESVRKQVCLASLLAEEFRIFRATPELFFNVVSFRMIIVKRQTEVTVYE